MNRKQRRQQAAAARRGRKAAATPTPPRQKLTPQQRMVKLNQSVLVACNQLANPEERQDADMCMTVLLSNASLYALLAGDDEDIFIARCRTLYQQAKKATLDAAQQVITPPESNLVSPDGRPLG